jgi:hypothetical protein
MEKIELNDLLLSLLFNPKKKDRIAQLVPSVLRKIFQDLEIPLISMDYCNIISVDGNTITYKTEAVPSSQITPQGMVISFLVEFEKSKLIDLQGAFQDYIMEKIS